MNGKALSIAIIASVSAFGHCDSVEGPVVQAARQALAVKNVNVVLPWVRPEQEVSIREAFARTEAVRSLGKEAQRLADTWFFETVVRIHRAGEGAPYEGLKPSGAVPAGIAAADAAIEKGHIGALENEAARAVREGLRQRFAKVQELKARAPEDVKAGRAYVAAYVEFIHFAERLHETVGSAKETAHEHQH